MMDKHKMYDIAKYIANIGLPALAGLVTALAEIWEIPYSGKIAASIMAVSAFLTALLRISNILYEQGGNVSTPDGEKGEDYDIEFSNSEDYESEQNQPPKPHGGYDFHTLYGREYDSRELREFIRKKFDAGEL